MFWLTWRQFRAQAITALMALTAFAVMLVLTESHMNSLYDSSGILGCHGGACTTAANNFLQNLTSGQGVSFLPNGANAYVIVYFLSVLVILIAPAILGCFWGAPLIARELETGTSRLIWNQSITRARWLMVKLALVGAAAMAVTEGFSLLQAWWAAPIGRAVGLGGGASIMSEGRFGTFVFPSHGITPLGYAAFCFALGVTVGLLIRRAISAMALTLVVFALVQLVTALWIRPNLYPTSQTTTTIAAAGANAKLGTLLGTMTVSAASVPGHPGAWIISSGAVNTAGQPTSTIPAACASTAQSLGGQGRVLISPQGSPALNQCLSRQGIRVSVSYQPESNYWPLQASETAFYLVLTLGLAGYSFWRLNRRLA
jgi:hypothetical protein